MPSRRDPIGRHRARGVGQGLPKAWSRFASAALCPAIGWDRPPGTIATPAARPGAPERPQPGPRHDPGRAPGGDNPVLPAATSSFIPTLSMPSPRRSGSSRRRSLALAGLAALALAGGGSPRPALAVPPTASQLQALEDALNAREDGPLAALLQQGPGLDPARLQSRRQLLRQQFPNARWSLRPGPALRDGRPSVSLRVTGTRQQGPSLFRLDGQQRLVLDTDGRRFSAQTVLREATIVNSSDGPLPVSLLIPDAVLTGQRYDLDVIFDEPLDGAYVAGGLTALSQTQVALMESPTIELSALGAGGLFKTVQAPYKPGTQMWAVLLVHPRGVVSATKLVRVVADKASLVP